MAYPETLGRYRLLRLLARGGQGDVWVAEPLHEPGRSFALKTVRQAEGSDPKALKKLIDEARIGVAVSTHPNVVRTLDVGLEGERAFIVMELLEGRSLAQLAGTEPLPPGLVVGLALPVLSALEHLQRAPGPNGEPLNLVHRDLKPSNLFVTAEGDVKLIDFGISLADGIDATTTKSGIIRGTVCYLSPEQARGDRANGKSDLYSLGVVMHELLTGRRMVMQQAIAAQLTAILYSPIEPVRSARPEVPEALDRAVLWTLEKDPAQRPRSPGELAEALVAALAPDVPWDRAQIRSWSSPRAPDKEVRLTASLPQPVLIPLPTNADPPVQGVTVAGRTETDATYELPPRVSQLQRRLLTAVSVLVLLLAALVAVRFVQRSAAPGPVAEVRAVAEPEPAEPEAAPVDGAPLPAPAVRSPKPHAKPRALVYTTIDSRPTWATVSVDGKELGPTPLVRVPLSAGTHQLEARNEKGQRKSMRLKLSEGREEKVLLEW
jgi:serine/threonine protein kinase